MKYLIFLISFLSSTGCLLAQETTFIENKTPNGYFEEFYVLKDDKNIKHGAYVKYRYSFGTILVSESGNYEKGQKHGEWQYFHDSRKFRNSLKERGTYFTGLKNGLWTSFHLDSTTNNTTTAKYGKNKSTDSIAVNIGQKALKINQTGLFIKNKRIGEWVTYDYNGKILQKYNTTTSQLLYDSSIKDSSQLNLNRKALFLGGKNALTEYVQENISTFLPDLSSRPTILLVSIIIDKNGKVADVIINESNLSKATNRKIIDQIFKSDYYWIPALKNATKISHTIQVGWKISKERTASNAEKWKVAFTLLD